VEPNEPRTPEGEVPDVPEMDIDPALGRQDGFRKVYLGQASDPLFPPHPGEPEAPEDELTRAALEDPGPEPVNEPRPTFWRFIILMLLAVLALGLIFRWLR
jgi:hypothetical protein